MEVTLGTGKMNIMFKIAMKIALKGFVYEFGLSPFAAILMLNDSGFCIASSLDCWQVCWNTLPLTGMKICKKTDVRGCASLYFQLASATLGVWFSHAKAMQLALLMECNAKERRESPAH